MSNVQNNKDEIIKQIMDLRTLIGEIENSDNEDKIMIIQTQINKIHDMIFNI